MKKILITLSFITVFFAATAQETVSIGNWRGHFPYNAMTSVASDYNGNVYAASKFSLFSYNKATGLIDIYSKINYLSDIGITCIRYSNNYNTLLIAYSNANLDLLVDGKIYNMNDIYRSNIVGNKTINKIFVKDRYAYLSCGFGIVVIDLLKREVADTYYIGSNGTYVNVLDFAYMDNIQSFIAATDNGLYIANADDNLSNFVNWHKIEDMPHATSVFNEVEYFYSNLIANVRSTTFNSDTLLVFNGSNWRYFSENLQFDAVNDISVSEDTLVITCLYDIKTYNSNLEYIENYWQYWDENGAPNPVETVKDGKSLWVADSRFGLVECTDPWKGFSIKPSGPEVSQAFNLIKEGKKMYAVPGGYNLSWVPLYSNAKYSVFEDYDWKTFSSADIPDFADFSDFTDVAVDPRNSDRVFIASYFHGLIEINNGEVVNVYNGSNSPMLAPTGYTDEYVRCGGIVFDDDNNLWVTHSLGSGVLNVLLADGTWANASNGGLFPNVNNADVSSIVIDHYGSKWIKTRSYASIYVMNDGGTPKNPSDDKYKILTNAVGNGALSGQISSIAVDYDGEVWIGSDLGLKVIYNPRNIFEGGSFDAQEILVEYDGTIRPLLESESVTAIAVDFGNNKWIGTASSGVYYISGNGTIQYNHFTKENSCLLSNNITAISVNYDGEVFISTSNGICSYKGESSEPSDDNSGIYAFPNPVRPEYTGNIGVTGLVEDAFVKIVDMAGRVVYSQQSNGGMITWDGNLPNGNRASSGVYIVFATNSSGKERAVTKILFIK